MGLNFYYYDGLQPEIRAGIINEHECIRQIVHSVHCTHFFLQKWYFVTKLFSRTVRKNCFSDLENLLKFEVKNLSNFSDHSNNLFKK